MGVLQANNGGKSNRRQRSATRREQRSRDVESALDHQINKHCSSSAVCDVYVSIDVNQVACITSPHTLDLKTISKDVAPAAWP